MKKLFFSPLSCLALVLVLPLQVQSKSKEAQSYSSAQKDRNERLNELSEFAARLSMLDQDELSPLGKVKKDSVISKEDFLDALAIAPAVIAEYKDDVSGEQLAAISDLFNELIDAIEQDDEQAADEITRGCSSLCDDSVLKIKKILCALNKAIFCDIVVFREKAFFCKHVQIKESLEVEHRAKIHKLKVKKAEIDKIEARKIEVKKIEAREIEAKELETCELVVDCNIYMQDSTVEVGNIYKDGDRFIHNFGTDNTFVGKDAGNFTMTGQENVAFGNNALSNNATGASNAAFGFEALLTNDANNNTAIGYRTLRLNATGAQNTAVGQVALQISTSDNNTAVGQAALIVNTTGGSNTAVGQAALVANSTGSNNIAVGQAAGVNLTTGSNNIDIGNAGVADESATIRIGTVGTQTANFQAGIFGAGPIAGAAVLVDAAGQLGTVVSSIRYKENVRDMNAVSSPIYNLRPVIFNYISDLAKVDYCGLIAEEVNEVLPELVVRGLAGEIETVKYHDLAILLLNELIKLEARVAILEEQIAY